MRSAVFRLTILSLVCIARLAASGRCGKPSSAGNIALFFGDPADIPHDWCVCDGANGTPDLRDRFLIGAGSVFPFGTSGGAASIGLTVAQMPNHDHSLDITAMPEGTHDHDVNIRMDAAADHVHGAGTYTADDHAFSHAHSIDHLSAIAGGHLHAFGGVTDPGGLLPIEIVISQTGGTSYGVHAPDQDPSDHVHTFSGTTGLAGEHRHDVTGDTDIHVDILTHSFSGTSGSGGGHSHGISALAELDGEHTHNVTGQTGGSGAGEPVEIMNPYYSVYFICLVPSNNGKYGADAVSFDIDNGNGNDEENQPDGDEDEEEDEEDVEYVEWRWVLMKTPTVSECTILAIVVLLLADYIWRLCVHRHKQPIVQ